jgi:putative hydrolase of the HAD superfamily
MSRYDAVIFDLFGTLVHNVADSEFRLLFEGMSAAIGCSLEEFDRVWSDTYPARTTGQFPDLESNLRHVSDSLQLGASSEQIAEAMRLRHELQQRCLMPRPDAVPTLAGLREAGYRLGLISDCSPEIPGMWTDHPIAPLLDDAIFSCSVGLRKPDPEIFRLACRHLAVTPERCIFVGDGGSDELAGAARVGMRPVRVRVTHEDLRRHSWDGETITTLAKVLDLVD